jgi:hypothetical protein
MNSAAELPTGFVLDSSRESLNKLVTEKIARMCNLKPEDVSVGEIIHLVENLDFSDEFSIRRVGHLIKKYLGIDFYDQKLVYALIGDERRLRLLQEISQRLKQFAEYYRQIEPRHLSFGVFAPAYAQAYKEIDFNQGSRFNSLLVGALTIDTVFEYTALTKSFFPKAQTFTLDIEGEETRKASDFIFGSGAKLPFAGESLNLIQTNYLLHMLQEDSKNPDAINPYELRRMLFREFRRVLKTGGRIVMVEGKNSKVFPGSPDWLVPMLYKKEFETSGFNPNNIFVRPAASFQKWDSIYAMLRSSVNLVDDFPKTDDSGAYLITAEK